MIAQSLGTEHTVPNWYLRENRDNIISNENLSMVLFCDEEYLLDINFELKNHKAADFMKIVLAVCRLVRCREK